jgi:hypothetical protein
MNIFKARLIESFVWLFMQVEFDFLEDLEVEVTEKILTNSIYYPVRCYLCDFDSIYLENNSIEADTDYLEILDHMINLSVDEKVKINVKVMDSYSENDILMLISNTVRLI